MSWILEADVVSFFDSVDRTTLKEMLEMRLWLIIALVCGVSSLACFALFEGSPPSTQAFINMFAGGAILVMLADTMIPEAFEHGGNLTGLVNVMGFALAVYFSLPKH